MAEDKRIIRIEVLNLETNESGMESKSKKKKKTPEQEFNEQRKQQVKELNEALHPVQTAISSYTSNSVVNQAKLGLAKQAWEIIEQSVDYAINRHLNLTENYIAQNDYNKIKSIYGITKGAVSSIASGAAQGMALGGFVGAGVGAAIGALNWGITTTIQQSERYSQYYQQLNAINFNTQYNQKRAGLYDGSRGTEG